MSKRTASKGKSSKKTETKVQNFKDQHAHLFPKRPRDFGIGRDVQPKRNLSRFVKWPKYVRLQRQRAILFDRLKVPGPIQQFQRALDKNQAANVFRLLSHLRPESHAEKRLRLKEQADGKGQADQKPRFVKFGINHVTDLVESRKAKLVIIAHDVNPIELVVWLPALCRRMDVPYCIVKGKARLGHVVHQKNATALAITDVAPNQVALLDQIVSNVRPLFNDSTINPRAVSGMTMGVKARAREARIEKARQAEITKKLVK